MEKKTDPYRPLFDHMDQEHGLVLLDSEIADIIHIVEKMQVGVKLTPEQIEERKKAIDWYRNPGAEPVQQSAAKEDEIKAAWKKRMGISFDEYGAMQDYCFYQQGYDDAASVIRQSAVWVKAYNGMPDGIYNMKVASKIRHVVMLGVGSVVGGEIVLITFLNKTTFGKEDVQKEDVTVYYLDENPAPAKESDAVDVIEFAEWAAQIGWFDEEYHLWNFFEEGKMVDGRFRFTTSEFYELFKKTK